MIATRATLVVATVLASFAAVRTHACMCIDFTPKTAFKQAAEVFVGEVVAYRNGQATMHVLERFKGPRTTDVAILSNGLGCGYGELTLRSRHLIYARADESFLVTDMCTRSKPYELASRDLAFLRSRAWWWRSPLSSFRFVRWLRGDVER